MQIGTSIKRLAGVAGVAAVLAALSGTVGAQTLKIGVTGPMTGGCAPWGNAAAEGTRLAAADVNATGGLEVGGKKHRVDVVSYDDDTNALLQAIGKGKAGDEDQMLTVGNTSVIKNGALVMVGSVNEHAGHSI